MQVKLNEEEKLKAKNWVVSILSVWMADVGIAHIWLQAGLDWILHHYTMLSAADDLHGPYCVNIKLDQTTRPASHQHAHTEGYTQVARDLSTSLYVWLANGD